MEAIHSIHLYASEHPLPTNYDNIKPSEVNNIMKKIILMFLMITMFELVPYGSNKVIAAVPAPVVLPNPPVAPCPAGTYRVRRNSKTKKKLVNALIAGGIGAAIGGGIGGGRGALIGLGSGSGGYLVYRYVRDRKGRCVPRYIRRG
jgi:hypothetical protein